MSPLFFLLYVNDIELTSLVLQYIMFADETNVSIFQLLNPKVTVK